VKELLNIVNTDNVPFTVRMVSVGDYRMGNRVNDGPEPIVEFYDARYTEDFTEFGQFVSSYYVSSFREDTRFPHGLSLYGGVDSWYISWYNVKEVVKWIDNILK
jgi:hypothetical protein